MSYEIDGRTNGPAMAWPGRARIAVMVTFDFDAEFLRMSRALPKAPPLVSPIIPGANTAPGRA